MFAKLLPTVALALMLPSCEWDGNFTILGYTTEPNYDTTIHTVRVPIFKNLTMRRGLEFDLTAAVVRDIELMTPYKVVQGDADTELLGTIISFNKNIINRNQLNEIREAETTLGVELVWKDLRTGDILTRPQRQPGAPPVIPPQVPATLTPGTSLGALIQPGALSPPGPLPPPGTPPPPGPPPPPPPVLVQSIGSFAPEIGQSLTSAYKMNVDRLAVQIVSMMEKPW